MSVLIKGMEMPTSCDSCQIMEFEDTNCVEEFYCGCPIVFKAHPQGVDHRPDYCPLIEVPEPHGRLIDADALDVVLKNEAESLDVNVYACGIADGLSLARSCIETASTIIPANGEG